MLSTSFSYPRGKTAKTRTVYATSSYLCRKTAESRTNNEKILVYTKKLSSPSLKWAKPGSDSEGTPPPGLKMTEPGLKMTESGPDGVKRTVPGLKTGKMGPEGR